MAKYVGAALVVAGLVLLAWLFFTRGADE